MLKSCLLKSDAKARLQKLQTGFFLCIKQKASYAYYVTGLIHYRPAPTQELHCIKRGSPDTHCVLTPSGGPSDWSRTSGLVVPNHALCHLSYTRLYIRKLLFLNVLCYYTHCFAKLQEKLRFLFTDR